MFECCGDDPAKQVGQVRLQRSVISIRIVQLWLTQAAESSNGPDALTDGPQLLPQQDLPSIGCAAGLSRRLKIVFDI